jgi:hypothetical protein
MSRWHTRLAELRATHREATAGVQNVQFVQNTPSTPSFEHFERFEQTLERPETPNDATTDAANVGPRQWAEALARLDPAQQRADVPVGRWRTFIDDCRRFIDAGWAARAAALGWQPHDLFGCDRLRPFARIDRAGLLWLLCGRKLLALASDTAVIETHTGGHQTYYRRSARTEDLVLAWGLDQ